MSHVFPRNCHSTYPTAIGGEGCYLIDKSGKRYFDGSCGVAVSCLGHSHEKVKQAIKDQIDRLAFAHTSFFTSDPAEELADLLIAHAPGNLERAYFVSSGSETIETALKLARQYHLERGEPQRRHLVARRQSYHGNTLGALAAGGNQWRRAQFEPMLIEVSHISPCYEYAERPASESAHDYGQRVANELEAEILRLGQDSVMAFIAEPVVGATLGAVPPVEGYFKRIREICDKYGVLLILDEVMCGMGRTGHLFACTEEGVAPDILTIAKGLGAGYQPVGAMLCSGQVYDAIAHGSGFFQHGHTYIGHSAACAAGLAVVNTILEDDLVSRARDMGTKLDTALRSELGQHGHVGDIRGRGLFRGLEFVEDHDTRQPFDPAKGLAKKLKAAAFEEGLICYPMSGTRDGRNGDHVLLAPPFILEDDHVAEITEKLSRAVRAVT